VLKKLKVGIVGCGCIASKLHIPAFERLSKSAVISAVCDISPIVVASVAKKANIPNAYSNLTEMLQKEDLDIVDICTPPHTHSALSIEAMEKGVNVLLEKPMALKLSECDEMTRVSKRTDTKLCIIHNELFRSPVLRARKMIDEGTIGKVMGMQWCRLTHREEYLAKENHWIHKLPGGILNETGPHGIYTSLAFLRKITNIEIAASNVGKYPWAPFDYFDIILEGEGGICNVIISHASDNYVADMNIYGTKGILKVDLQSMVLIHYNLRETKPIPLALSSLTAARQIVGGLASSTTMYLSTRPPRLQVDGHAMEIEQFVDSIQQGREPPVTAEDGIETIRVLELLVQRLEQKYHYAH
jgi:predicted dehydrogenase